MTFDDALLLLRKGAILWNDEKMYRLEDDNRFVRRDGVEFNPKTQEYDESWHEDCITSEMLNSNKWIPVLTIADNE